QDRDRWSFLQDISADGLFLGTSDKMPKGTEIELHVALEDKGDPISIVGKVVRVDTGRKRGVAIRFDPNAVKERAAIAKYVLGHLETKARDALKRRAGNLAALEELASVAAERGDARTALDCYRQILDVDPEHATACGRLAEHAFDQARKTNDAKLFQEALSHLEAGSLAACHPSWKRFEGDVQRALVEVERAKQAEEARKKREELEKKRELERRAQEAEQKLKQGLREVERLKEDLERRASKVQSEQKALQEREKELDAARAELGEEGRKAKEKLRRAEEAQVEAIETRKRELATERRKLRAQARKQETDLEARESALDRGLQEAERKAKQGETERGKLAAAQKNLLAFELQQLLAHLTNQPLHDVLGRLPRRLLRRLGCRHRRRCGRHTQQGHGQPHGAHRRAEHAEVTSRAAAICLHQLLGSLDAGPGLIQRHLSHARRNLDQLFESLHRDVRIGDIEFEEGGDQEVCSQLAEPLDVESLDVAGLHHQALRPIVHSLGDAGGKSSGTLHQRGGPFERRGSDRWQLCVSTPQHGCTLELFAPL
ncbi:PilZ domain-containing protein, partial [Myxococcota bacterium]